MMAKAEKLNQVTIQFPFYFFASDYHEFREVQSLLRAVTGTERIDYKEVDEITEDYPQFGGNGPYGKSYLAIFHLTD